MHQEMELIVKIVPQRKDSFVVLPKTMVDSLRPTAANPSLEGQFVPIRILLTSQAPVPTTSSSPSLKIKKTENSNDDISPPPQPSFAGALVSRNSSSDRMLEIGPTLANDLSIGEADIVSVSPVGSSWKVAKKLEIVPVDINESEVVEKNALLLQNSLMQSLRVLSLGQRITLRTPAGICARVEVLRGSAITTPANASCYVLTQGTELHIAVKTRETAKSATEAVRPPIPGKLKVISANTLSSAVSIAYSQQGSTSELVEQLINQQRTAGTDKMHQTTTSTTKQLMDGSDPTIFVSPQAAADLAWVDGLLVGYYNATGLLWCNDGESEKETTFTQKRIQSATTSKFGACTPNFLREFSVLGRVRILRGGGNASFQSVDAILGTNAWCVIPALLSTPFPHETITIIAVPNPPVQLFGRTVGCGEGTNRDGSPVALQSLISVLLTPTIVSNNNNTQQHHQLSIPKGIVGSSLSYMAVEEVHGGGVLGELRDAISPCSSLPTSLFNRNVILVGPRGSGKSTLVGRTALSSGRHVVYVDCNAAPTSLNKTVNAAIAQAAVCTPSILILDGLDAIASTSSGSARQGPTQLSTATTHMLYSWLVETARCYGDISIVATAHSYEELVPLCKLPQCFPTVIKMPATLLVDGKHALVRQLVNLSITGSIQPTTTATHLNDPTVVLPASVTKHAEVLSQHLASKLAPALDNYSATDIAAITARVLRRCVPSSLPTALSNTASTDKEQASHIVSKHIAQTAIDDVVTAFVPQSRAGISFLQSGEGAGAKKATWDDAGGLKEAKAALYDVLVLPSKYPHIFKNLPLKSKSGIMLHGPSGCGKTYLLSVVAAAENLHCIVVNGPEIFGKYIGTSEQKIREIFENAQAAAPCVVFFDEFDSVAPRRGNSNTGVTDRVVNQLLCYLDGVESRSDVYVVAATSRPDLIDPALLRPGRLDRHVECPMPSQPDRMEIFAAHLRTAAEGREILSEGDLATLASATESWTSADIAGLVSSAHTHMLQRFLNVTVGSLLGEDEDAPPETSAEDPFALLESSHGVVPDGDDLLLQKRKLRQKTLESLRRVATGRKTTAASAAGTADGGSSGGHAEEVNLPTLQVSDLQEAMLTFNRSRQVEKAPQSPNNKRGGKNLTQEQLSKIQQMVGTRQTSQ